MTTLPERPATPLRLPFPESLPWRPAEVAAAAGAAASGLVPESASDPAPRRDPVRMLGEETGRDVVRAFLAAQWDRAEAAETAGTAAPQEPAHEPPQDDASQQAPTDRRWILGPPTAQAQAEQVEHDRYFAVRRDDGGAPSFVAGLLGAHLAAADNAAAMGLALVDRATWHTLHAGLIALFESSGIVGASPAELPLPAADDPTAGHDPAARWLIGHQLFFALIQGAVVGLNCFAAATVEGRGDDADRGLRLAAAFLRSSSAAMRFTCDFDPADYESTVRKDMAPPKVREGFSGFQTRDHAHMVRLLTALRPLFAARAAEGPAGGAGAAAHTELVDAVADAYAAHEFICARFRGDVLPSLRMAAASRGMSDRPGVEVVRELMRKRLGLLAPAGAAVGSGPGSDPGA